MVARTGSNTFIGVTLNNVPDTVIQAAAGHKMEVDSMNYSKNTTEISLNPIGGGVSMQAEGDAGDFKPSISIDKKLRYDEQGIALIAQMMGIDNCNTTGSGGFCQSILFNEALNTNYATVAFQSDSASVAEFINATVTKVNITVNPHDYLTAKYDLLATDKKITGTTNTAVSLSAATTPASKAILARPTHRLRINLQSAGALANGDTIAITNFDVSYSREQELVPEIRGSAGNGVQRASGKPPFQVEFTITLKTKVDDVWFTALDAATEYKADFEIVGDLIGGAISYTFGMYFPRLKIVTDPKSDLTTTGENDMTVTFKALAATSIPTGFIDTKPYFRVISTRSTKYTA